MMHRSNLTEFVRVRGLLSGALAMMLLTFAPSAVAQNTSDGTLAGRPNGPRSAQPNRIVLSGATIHVSPGKVIENGSVVIRDGQIESVSAGVIGAGDRAGYQHFDAKDLHIYAGFIDAYVEADTPKADPKRPGAHVYANVTPDRSALDGLGLDRGTRDALRKSGFVAASVAPSGGNFRGRTAVVSLRDAADDASAERPTVYRERAGHVVSFDTGGFDGGYPSSQIGAIALARQVLSDFDFLSGLSNSGANGQRSSGGEADNCILALARSEPLVFIADDELESLRAAKVAREFERDAIVVGSGTEFRRLDAIRGDGLAHVIPLRFAEEPDLSSVGAIDAVSLRDLMTFEQAPTNVRRLDDAGITIALTTSRARARGEDRGAFHKNLRTAIEHGLSEDRALAMLTTNPATMLGVAGQLGTVEAGKRACLVVADGPIFSDKTKIRDVYIDGVRTVVNAEPDPDASGTWSATIDGDAAITLEIADKSLTLKKPGEGADAKPTEKKASAYSSAAGRLSFAFDHAPFGTPGVFTLSGVLDGERMIGTGLRADGSMFQWSATRTAKPVKIDGRWKATSDIHQDATIVIKGDSIEVTVGDEDAMKARNVEIKPDGSFTFVVEPKPPEGEEPSEANDTRVTGSFADGKLSGRATPPGAEEYGWTAVKADDEKKKPDVPEDLGGYPFGTYSMKEIPAHEYVLFEHATVWTCGPQGVIEDGVVYFGEGKIGFVGSADDWASFVRTARFHANGYRTIDARGMHITPGLLDCHSHTGTWTAGTNESGEAITAEVRMADGTDPDPVNWYRQLAGGVTTVNTLHGSANAIGGQNVVQKNRWGAIHPDDLHFQGAQPGIKFALGENPRAVNWGERWRWRYPQSRMGVESLIRDRFVAARDYASEWKRYEDAKAAGKTVTQPRRDLELEAIAEILRGERLVHCHSYRQDEILMLCRLAQEFGFRIGTFQHVLEGYKVADEIRESAIGASSFSDWWGYKIEVQDAIPHDGAIMHSRGVVVSFNSDSDELARRMNTEAAKATRYGGVEAEEALKFVTINPAIQLNIQHRVGSLETNKDADIAVWSGPPMSTLSRCVSTWVDGREYFSIEKDMAHRERIAKERERIIQKVLAKGDKKEEGPPAGPGGAGRRQRPGEEFASAEEEQYFIARREYYLDLYRRGINPADASCGDCGCGENHFFRR